MEITSLAIIGTAGRKEDQNRLTKKHYPKMIDACLLLINHLRINPHELELISGGAAWSDHLAVTLFLNHFKDQAKLTLYLPAEINTSGYCNYQNDFEKRTVDTANYYHKVFTQKTGIDSILDINRAIDEKATIIIKKGFKQRNSLVANHVSNDHGSLLAFTFGSFDNDQFPWTIREHQPGILHDVAGLKDGGTADTFDKAKCVKFHVRLGHVH